MDEKATWLYFDHDHGRERLLFVEIDASSRSVRFRFESGPDATYDEESAGVPTKSVVATTRCPSVEELNAFCRALAGAMKATAFSLQDPKQQPFAAMSHDALLLDGFACAMPEALTSRIPAAILAELVDPDHPPEPFKILI